MNQNSTGVFPVQFSKATLRQIALFCFLNANVQGFKNLASAISHEHLKTVGVFKINQKFLLR